MSELEGLKLLRRIEEGVAGKTGEAFFRQIVRDLAGALGAHGAFTSRLLPGRRAAMLAFWIGERYEACLEYSLAGTPCEYVYNGQITSYARDVGTVFPVDREWFAQLGVQSYLGIPVKDESGEVSGHLAVMDTVERDWRDADIDVLRLFSLRTAAELERSRHEQELQEANAALRTMNEQLRHEIAERTRMEGELAAAKLAAESANHAKSVFISQMSHELRTPLNGILGFARLLSNSGEPLSASQAQGLATIERAGEHLLTLVNDLLDLARIEAGKLELHPEPIELGDLLAHAAELARLRAAQAGLSFSFDGASVASTPVLVDACALRQILLNLLGNAVKFTAPGGRVTLQAQAQQMEGARVNLQFTVSDTGVGIPAEELPRIFEPFHRIAEGSRVTEGTGLGLAVTRSVIDAMGGNISVQSKPGQGSRFTVQLQLAAATCELPSASAPPLRILGYEGPRRRLLVVDDDEDNRSLLERLLSGLGFEVQCAADGEDALLRLGDFLPHLVITDLVMPRLDGIALLKRLRTQPQTLDTPVIVVSASAGETSQRDALQAGCGAFVAKPLRFEHLLEQVRRLLELTWRYAAATAAPRASVAGSADFCLDPATADELYHLAMQGDVLALVQRLEERCGQDPAAQAFCSQIRVNAQRFDTGAIRRTLSEHRVAQTATEVC